MGKLLPKLLTKAKLLVPPCQSRIIITEYAVLDSSSPAWVNYNRQRSESSSEHYGSDLSLLKSDTCGVKICGAQIRTHDLWIRKRVCYPLYHSALQILLAAYSDSQFKPRLSCNLYYRGFILKVKLKRDFKAIKSKEADSKMPKIILMTIIFLIF